MTVADIASPALFTEPGGRWRSVAYGPLVCLAVLIFEMCISSPVHWFGLGFCAVLLAGFVALQVVAGRRHISVELTETTLRGGTETLPLRDIAAIYPERDEDAWDDEPWQSARALGELSGVPRRRTGIGLKLRNGATVQAWARDHRQLRAELTTLLDLPEASVPTSGSAVPGGDALSESAESEGVESESGERAASNPIASNPAVANPVAPTDTAPTNTASQPELGGIESLGTEGR